MAHPERVTSVQQFLDLCVMLECRFELSRNGRTVRQFHPITFVSCPICALANSLTGTTRHGVDARCAARLARIDSGVVSQVVTASDDPYHPDFNPSLRAALLSVGTP